MRTPTEWSVNQLVRESLFFLSRMFALVKFAISNLAERNKNILLSAVDIWE